LPEPLSATTFRQWIADLQWEIRRFEASGAFGLQQGNYHNCIGNICVTYAPDEAPLAFVEALRVWRQTDEPSNLVVAVLWKLGKTHEMAAECQRVLAAYADLAELPGHDLVSNARVSARPIGARNQLIAANAFLGRWDTAIQEVDRHQQAVEKLWPGTSMSYEEGLRRALQGVAEGNVRELSAGLAFLVCGGDPDLLHRKHVEGESWGGVA